MSDSNRQLGWSVQQAQNGDLRPQINPQAAVILAELPTERAALRPVLIDCFFQLKRPIADSTDSNSTDLRLQDAGPFFYLVEALRRVGYEELDQTLCVLLDEFAQLEERSYDELYLWCIVELSRRDTRHVETYWPLVLTLDLQYRSAPWQQSTGAHPVERPCRLTDLLFYYYVLYTPRKFQFV